MMMTSIKRFTPLILSAMMLLLLTTLAGCAAADPSGPTAYRQAEAAYARTLEAAVLAADAGRLTPSEAEAIETARIPANAILDEWAEALRAGRPFDPQPALTRALDAFILAQIRAASGTVSESTP